MSCDVRMVCRQEKCSDTRLCKNITESNILNDICKNFLNFIDQSDGYFGMQGMESVSIEAT